MLIKIIKVFIYSVVCLLCLVLLVFFGVAFMISQPTFTSGSPSDIEVSEQRLRSHVVMLSETFHPRNFMHSANTERVVDYIRTHFEVSGARVTLQEFDLVYPLTPAGEGVSFTFQNVIALFGEGKGDRIVIGAHYDSFQDTPFYRNPNYHLPGDTADTLDYRRMADVVRTVFAAASTL